MNTIGRRNTKKESRWDKSDILVPGRSGLGWASATFASDSAFWGIQKAWWELSFYYILLCWLFRVYVSIACMSSL
jgi:hypothetical protein